MIAGVDGCRSGWLVALQAGSGAIDIEIIRSAAEMFERWPELQLAVIDIPIGLTERTPRQADLTARRYLRRRGCTVFPAPYRAMLQSIGNSPEAGQAEASRIRRSLDGKGCSRQAYMIFDKIADVDSVMTPTLQSRLVEGHPEVSFAAMCGGQPIPEKKSTPAGKTKRMQALASDFRDVALLVEVGRSLGAQVDDVLDALVMLWTARRLISGAEVLRFPAVPEPVTNALIAQIIA